MDISEPGKCDSGDIDRELMAVEAAREDVDAGRVVSLEAVKAWVNTIGTQGELPAPRVR